MTFMIAFPTAVLGLTLVIAWLVDPSMRGAMRWRRQR